MKIKTLPPFYFRRKYPSALAKFVFDYEPECGAKESNEFRRQLVRVLNEAQGFRFKEADTQFSRPKRSHSQEPAA